MKILNYSWQFFARAICFFSFGVSALIISFLVFPLQALFIKDIDKRKKTARYTLHKAFRFLLGLLKFFGLMSLQLNNFERLKNMRGQVVIANHPSMLDVVLIIAYLPNADCVVKPQLFNNFFLRGVINRVGYIGNQDPEQLFIDCKNSLTSGANILVFPEGTRSVKDQALVFKRGAANIAIRCKANYQPIFIYITPTTLTKDESWYNVPAKKVLITLTVKAPIDNTKYFTQQKIPLAVRELTRETQQYFCKELKLNG